MMRRVHNNSLAQASADEAAWLAPSSTATPALARALAVVVVLVAALVLFCGLAAPGAAWADGENEKQANVAEGSYVGDTVVIPVDTYEFSPAEKVSQEVYEFLPESARSQDLPVDVSADGDAARISDCPYAVADFYRAQVGSNREINDVYYGYTYLLNGTGSVVAINTADFVAVHIPQALVERFSLDLTDADTQETLYAYLVALDDGQAMGNMRLSDRTTWYFTSAERVMIGDAIFSFGEELKEGRYYATILGEDDSDISDEIDPGNIDTCTLVPSEEAVITAEGTPLEKLGDFLSSMDYSPLWITLKTSGTAIVFVFILGLAAAYFTMRISSRAQDIFDTIFTIPMVLPPTVCGFLLLMLLGRNTPWGKWFIDVGCPLVFSWQATVIAAVVVAFPLMYRSARGAFENLDPNMMDAARTLGWSNAKIFFRLMLPLAWSSIAAGTVLAFARALGEFGCTLFLAGNQLGSTRTIPIAIYFEWMNGNQEATWFWTITLIVFSFVVILFINLWSRHTTKYRRRANETDAKASDEEVPA